MTEAMWHVSYGEREFEGGAGTLRTLDEGATARAFHHLFSSDAEEISQSGISLARVCPASISRRPTHRGKENRLGPELPGLKKRVGPILCKKGW